MCIYTSLFLASKATKHAQMYVPTYLVHSVCDHENHGLFLNTVPLENNVQMQIILISIKNR